MSLHEVLHSATTLLQNMQDAGEDRHPETGIEYADVKELREALDNWTGLSDEDVRTFMEERGQIALIWTTGDVQAMRADLNEEQAMSVLRYVRNNHDAELGVRWDTIADAALHVCGDPNTVLSLKKGDAT